MDFIPDEDREQEAMEIPFWEDANNAVGVIGYSTQKSQKELQAEIRKSMGFLGGQILGFQSGRLPFGKAGSGYRYAFRIYFTLYGSEGRLDVAALPIKKETSARIRDAKRHALYSVNARLEAIFNSQLVMPGDMPLVLNLLNSEGRTMLEFLQDKNMVPQLPSPPEEPIEGDFTEVKE